MHTSKLPLLDEGNDDDDDEDVACKTSDENEFIFESTWWVMLLLLFKLRNESIRLPSSLNASSLNNDDDADDDDDDDDVWPVNDNDFLLKILFKNENLPLPVCAFLLVSFVTFEYLNFLLLIVVLSFSSSLVSSSLLVMLSLRFLIIPSTPTAIQALFVSLRGVLKKMFPMLEIEIYKQTYAMVLGVLGYRAKKGNASYFSFDAWSII